MIWNRFLQIIIIVVLLLNVLLLVNFVPRSFAAKQIQYKVVQAPGESGTAEAVESMLNQYASAGWELILTTMTRAPWGVMTSYVFKKSN